ncbi:MAG: YwiC-like family protein [Verrucomicrobiia bacterium]
MTATMERPIVEEPVPAGFGPGRPPMPREHGAWGILLIPFATAVGVSGVVDVRMALLLTSVLCFYVARTSFLKQHAKWTFLLLAGSALCTAPLLIVWRLWWLAAFGVVAAALAFRRTERGVAMQLIAVAGLTLTAPAGWYAATGRLDRHAWLLWGLNFLYFAGGVFYVKMHVAAAIRRKPVDSTSERIALGAATLSYYAGMSAVLVVFATMHWISWSVLLAYAPVVMRAVVGVWRLSPTLRIKRLGWTEVAYSLVYAVLLILARS